MGVEGAGGTGFSPFWWRQADKALLSGAEGSHEWLCKQPKREGTFPLAESAVKRFPVTVIAVFGGIISAEAVGGGGAGAGRQGKARGDVWSACRQRGDGRANGEPGARRSATALESGGSLDKRFGSAPTLQIDPHSQESRWKAAHSSWAAFPLIPWVTDFQTSEPAATS